LIGGPIGVFRMAHIDAGPVHSGSSDDPGCRDYGSSSDLLRRGTKQPHVRHRRIHRHWLRYNTCNYVT